MLPLLLLLAAGATRAQQLDGGGGPVEGAYVRGGADGLTQYFGQRLDHFDRQETRTWAQRYFANDSAFVVAGPVFLCVGGEGAPLTAEVVMTGGPHCALMVEHAAAAGALVLALEHRYYGKSLPVGDFETASLRQLSSQQALADLAGLHAHATARYGLTAANRWVTFGGSYPGMLAAWARTKYPHLIHASVSSSSPVLAQLRMPEYQDVVAAALAYSKIGGRSGFTL
jgi:hypothetical protein